MPLGGREIAPPLGAALRSTCRGIAASRSIGMAGPSIENPPGKVAVSIVIELSGRREQVSGRPIVIRSYATDSNAGQNGPRGRAAYDEAAAAETDVEALHAKFRFA